ncbi:hypothetical protein CLTEP_04000 [Clostridium tepidiprofundi DSM 19306]|uniref:Uncharacterized protein n=1 Tax=Clostridium tepidiprofundi DSM 19306 TaxID=1121338 RepID=A0A151B7X4_9CLOT|nr:hypothetical protein [Clostridium tepidiprofundi]KYH36006.1 hypothetical protein CLTEP_04000 [Clostridium tepidiprofundi DSM 19306]
MPKDSQPDNKISRIKKSNGDTPITREVRKNHKNMPRKKNLS